MDVQQASVSFLAAAILIAGSPASMAAEDPYADYVRLDRYEASSANSSWNKAGGWSDGEVPDPSKNYYISETGRLFIPGGSSSISAGAWKGGQLVVRGAVACYILTNPKYSPSIADLVFLGGSRLENTGGYGILTNTQMTVLAPIDNPMTVYYYYASSLCYTYLYDSRFLGDVGTGIVFNWNSDSQAAPMYARPETFRNYFGTVTVRGAKTVLASDQAKYLDCGGSMVVDNSGTLMLHKGTYYTGDENAYFASLAVTNKGRVATAVWASKWTVHPVLNVTNSIRIANGGIYEIDSGFTTVDNLKTYFDKADNGIKLKIGRLGGNAADDYDFEGADVKVVGRGLDWKFLVSEEDGAGSRDLFLALTNSVMMTASYSSSKLPFAAGNGSMWTHGEVPTATSTYDCIFPGTRFYIKSSLNLPEARIFLIGGSHYWQGGNIVVKELNISGSCNLGGWSDTSKRRLSGGIVTIATGSELLAWIKSGFSLNIDSALRGTGVFRIKSAEDGGAVGGVGGVISLCGDNSDFHGRVQVDAPCSTGSCTILANARNWGGDYRADANTYQAIIVGGTARVSVTNSVSFEDPTRGMLIRGTARFNVADGMTMSLGNQVTYAGRFVKEGSGVLNLGGTARFINGAASTAPTVGTNVLEVTAGALKVSSKEACDGLSVAFAEGTKLIIPAESKCGLFDVKWDSPLAVGTTDGKLPVEIEPPEDPSGEDIEVVVATFNATAASGIGLDAFKVKCPRGYKLESFEKRENAETGDVSYVATIGKKGLLLLFR